MKEIARRINFFTASFIGVLGLSLVSEIIMEDDRMDKIDDILMVALGLSAIWWYKKSGYKLSKTTGSVIILVIALIIKFFAIYIEHADKEAVGDDFGILSALILAFVFVIWQTLHNKNK
jgi:hypothetical protein